nr:enoyl-CoA hydratase/isomerase family protein [Kordiimonas gwangyangensis]
MTVTLNRPEVKNAMNFAMVDALIDAFEQAAGDDAVRVVVLRGADGVFCAGGDLKDMGSAGQSPELSPRVTAALASFSRSRKPSRN